MEDEISGKLTKDLFVSPRTFQRRLADVGTAYSDILDAVRRELAAQYITDPALSLGDISHLLGFSELSGFSGAFRRWTGHPPSAVREGATVSVSYTHLTLPTSDLV